MAMDRVVVAGWMSPVGRRKSSQNFRKEVAKWLMKQKTTAA